MKIKEDTEKEIEECGKLLKETKGKFKCEVCGKELNTKEDIITFMRKDDVPFTIPTCFECTPEDVQEGLIKEAQEGRALKDFGETVLIQFSTFPLLSNLKKGL
ncbi:hypothetical protein ES708_23252 [subsurface metagenome]